MATIIIFLCNIRGTSERHLCSSGMILKRLSNHTILDIVEAISGDVPATFTEEVLRRISAATLADRVTFTETL